MAESTPPAGSVTEILRRAVAGDRDALDAVYPLLYEELRRRARRQLAGQGGGRTLSPTVLIHEVYLRFVDQGEAQFVNRAQFFGYAARVMRTVLVDHARARLAVKRGGDRVEVPLEDGHVRFDEQTELVLAVHEALARLGAHDDRLVRIVECRYFAGMSDEETAEALGFSARTVRRDWIKARTWLHGQLGASDGS